MFIGNVELKNNINSDAKPFLKWAGGKGQLLKEIEKYYAFGDKHFNKYVEPFVGGGAVLFDILNRYELAEVYISDINSELINTYKVIRDSVNELIEELSLYQKEYIPLDKENRKKYYLLKRERFNNLKIERDLIENIEKAALMIFLNRTCFNGLYRVNKKGFFNVPMGDYKNPLICDDDNLRTISKKLKNVKIICGDYKNVYDFIDSKTFVYIDPPYRPISETSNFISYNEEIFDDKKQIELAEFIRKINGKKAKFVLNNSDPKNIDVNDNFFDELYKQYKIIRVSANRSINSIANKRGKINELLITNNFNEVKKMKRDFNLWLSTFRKSIANYKYYVDFDKVYKNVSNVELELNILNTIIKAEDIEKKFEEIILKYPEVLKCIPILLAVRASEIYVADVEGEYNYNFKKRNYSVEQYKIFMRKTGLFDLIKKRKITNFIDYVTGVETGLDSNGRKNRGGDLMENLVEEYIKKAGFIKEKTYFKEMTISKINEKWGLDLSLISNKGKTEKRFDFVISTGKKIYGIEANFYGSGGSKLNETARSYKTIALEAESVKNFEFVWFTDGKGWEGAKNNLEETFDIMDNIYNINDLDNGIISEVFK